MTLATDGLVYLHGDESKLKQQALLVVKKAKAHIDNLFHEWDNPVLRSRESFRTEVVKKLSDLADLCETIIQGDEEKIRDGMSKWEPDFHFWYTENGKVWCESSNQWVYQADNDDYDYDHDDYDYDHDDYDYDHDDYDYDHDDYDEEDDQWGDVQGGDVQGGDVQGGDVQGSDVQGSDVQGSEVQGSEE